MKILYTPLIAACLTIASQVMAVTDDQIQRHMATTGMSYAKARAALLRHEQQAQAQGHHHLVTHTPDHIQQELSRAVVHDPQGPGAGGGAASSHHHPTSHVLSHDDELAKMQAEFERQKAEMLRQHQEAIRMKMLREQEAAAEQQRQTAEAARKKAALDNLKAQQEAELRAMQEALQKEMQEASTLGLGTGVTKPLHQAVQDEGAHKFTQARHDLSKAETHLPAFDPSKGALPPPPHPEFHAQLPKPVAKPTGFRGTAAAMDSDDDDLFEDTDPHIPTKRDLEPYIEFENPKDNPLSQPIHDGGRAIFEKISGSPKIQPHFRTILDNLRSTESIWLKNTKGDNKLKPTTQKLIEEIRAKQLAIVVWFIERANPSIAYKFLNGFPSEGILRISGGSITILTYNAVLKALPPALRASFEKYRELMGKKEQKRKVAQTAQPTGNTKAEIERLKDNASAHLRRTGVLTGQNPGDSQKVLRALNYKFQEGLDSGTLSDDKMKAWAHTHTVAEARALSPADGPKLFSM